MKSAFRPFSPLRHDRRPPRPHGEGETHSADLAGDVKLSTSQVVTDLGEHLRDLIEAIDDPSLIVEGSNVRLANARAASLLGTQIEGRDVRLVIRHPQVLELVLAHGSGSIDATGIIEPERSWQIIIRRLWPDATLVRMVDCSQTVSVDKMRVDFVANASHELRTPLSTVLGYAETLSEEGDLPADLRVTFGETIRHEAGRMLRIIEDLMSLSRIEADRFLVPDEEVDVREIVDVAVSNAAYMLSARGCEFKLDIPAALPPLRGDRGQLVQVLDNLISNALRYGCDKAGSAIRITAGRSGPWVTITVADSGQGIPREHLPRLTERFYRVDPARSRGTGGTGLGLAIVKHIIERHRGFLEIKSTLGVGTSVNLRLPLSLVRP